MDKIIEAKFIKVPKPNNNDIEKTTQEEFNKIFQNMIGHKYNIYLSELNKEYIILGGATEEAEKEFQKSIYKSLISIGEDEQTAKEVAYEGEDYGSCMYFSAYCFDINI
ncbi:MAG: hypothetical protein HFJ48_00005 [Clostridia bacterium]|nr:hypothetical protein [Clostridia bacterium]